jgi:ABC-type dipeptide/oligopeptide/nickel transport system permease subunit
MAAMQAPSGDRQTLPPEERPLVTTWRRFRKNRGVIPSLVLLTVLSLSALLAPVLAPHDPIKPNLAGGVLQPPSVVHWFGTDELGRDVFSRLLYGSQISLSVGLISVGIALGLGITLGLLAGYFRGKVDAVIMRVMDAFLAFPSLVLALAITAVLGASLGNAMIAIGLVAMPTYARLVRGQVMAVSSREFVEAAHALGARDKRIMLIHILPNIMAPIIVQSTLNVATAILSEAGLSFLGLGVQPPTPSWGSMIAQGRSYLEIAPWMIFVPGTAIFLVVLAFNFLGDGLRDALDPRMKNR